MYSFYFHLKILPKTFWGILVFDALITHLLDCKYSRKTKSRKPLGRDLHGERDTEMSSLLQHPRLLIYYLASFQRCWEILHTCGAHPEIGVSSSLKIPITSFVFQQNGSHLVNVCPRWVWNTSLCRSTSLTDTWILVYFGCTVAVLGFFGCTWGPVWWTFRVAPC